MTNCWTTMQNLPNILFTAGLVAIFSTSLFSWIIAPAYINWRIAGRTGLENGTETWKAWIQMPVEMHTYVYLYNVTNPEEIIKGSLPKLDEVGPYVYEQTRERIVHDIDYEKDTVKYQFRKKYTFRPELSYGSESDVVQMINVPLAAIPETLRKLPSILRYIARGLLEKHYKVPIFFRRTVEEVLFKGKVEPILKELGEAENKTHLPNNTFAFFYEENNTLGKIIEIKTGTKDEQEVGQVVSVNGKTSLDIWGSDACNKVRGTDGSLYPPFLTKDSKLEIYSPDLSRTLDLEFDGEESLKNVPGFKFTLKKNIFAPPKENSSNSCYCVSEDKSSCEKQPNGVFNIAPIRRGAPIFVSLPHFLHGDKSLNKQSGTDLPDVSRDQLSILIEPHTGVFLSSDSRIQVNMEVKRAKLFKEMKKLQTFILPLLWYHERAILDDYNTSQIRRRFLLPTFLLDVSKWIGIACGILMMITSILIQIARRRSKPKKMLFYT